MKITSILDPRKRKRAFNRAIKRTKWAFTRPRSSIPVFVFGKQRSGTTMFMDILENREDTEVYQEWDKSVYLDSRIRSLDAVAEAIEKSRAPFVCFKPICDSHLIGDFVSRFPEGKYIWIIRNYLDSANSEIRRFPDSEHAVRLTCEGKPGGGWLQESMSAKALKRLQEIYSPDFSQFEFSCLIWWMRNNLILEAGQETRKQFHLLHYEDLVTNPAQSFQLIQRSLSIPVIPHSYGNVHARSILKNSYPDIGTGAKELCDELTEHLKTIISEQNSKYESS